MDIELTFKNVGYPASNGTVSILWERAAVNVPLSGVFRRGNITEAELGLDVNGDNDRNDIFIVRYVEYAHVKIDGTTAKTIEIPEQTKRDEGGSYHVYDERNNFIV